MRLMVTTVSEFEIVIAALELKLEIRSFIPDKDPVTDVSRLFVGDTLNTVLSFTNIVGIGHRMRAVDLHGRHVYIVRVA